MARVLLTGSISRLRLVVGLSSAVIVFTSVALPAAQTRQTTKEPWRENSQEAELKSFYETHQWFKLRDALRATSAPAFYRGAVSYAFNDIKQAEKNLKSVIESAPQSQQASEARTMLINIYMRSGRYRQALSEAEKELAVSPNDAGLKNASALLTTLSQSKSQEVSQLRPSKIRYSMKGGNLFIPVEVNGKRAAHILDTGANFSLISEAEAKRLGLTFLKKREHKIEDSSGAKVDFRIAVADRLTVGELSLRHVAFLVVGDDQQPFVELQPGERGVLGLPVILAFQTLRWKRDGTFELGFATSGRAEQMSGVCLDGLQPVIEGEFRQSKITLFLDTGAIRTRVLPLFAKEFSGFVTELGKKDSDRMTGVGGSVEVDALKLPELMLRIGGVDTVLRPAQVLLKETTSDSRWWHAWLGMDLLNQARVVTLDFKSMTLALE